MTSNTQPQDTGAVPSEKWLPVMGFEGFYEVSNKGRVRSLPVGRRKGDLLKQSERGTTTKYMCVTLYLNGSSKTKNVHRLVAEAFIPNPECKRTVNHKDGNGTNNLIDNLEWATDMENTHHALLVLGRKLQDKKVCKNGHIRTPENTRLQKRKVVFTSICKVCTKEYDKARRSKS